MKIEKLNKDNIKEFIRNMKISDTENMEINFDNSELYTIKKDDIFLIAFNSLSLVDNIAILYYNPKLSNDEFYECIEFLNRNLVVQNHLVIEIFNDKYMKLLDEKYKCKEMEVVLEVINDSYDFNHRISNYKEKFIDIEMNSIKYNHIKNDIICNFVKQNITDERLILDLHNFFTSLDFNYILYVIHEESYEYLKSLGYKCSCKRYIIKN